MKRLTLWQKIWRKYSQKNKNTPVNLPQQLLDILQFKPNNSLLFQEAYTPRSLQIKNKNGDVINYERLEFLGDAILGAVIAEYLYINSPKEQEGYLTKMRSKIVSRRHLNEIGNNLGLVNLAKRRAKKKVVLSNHAAGDMFEALVGAVYEDQGFEKCKTFINRVVIDPYVNIKDLENKIISYKSLMLEWAQKHKIRLEFKTTEERNAQNKCIFVSVISLNGKVAAKGRGTSKKKAEEKAAKRTYFSKQKKITKS